MADENQPTPEATEPKRGKLSYMVIAIVAIVSAAVGFVVPQVIGDVPNSSDEKSAADNQTAAPDSHAMEMEFVPYGEVVTNLDDMRMSRYLRAKFALAVPKSDAESVKHLLTANNTILKNWLIGFLQNKQIEDVRGTEGFNQVRREIREHFNVLLFPDGEGKVREILFEEFNVQ